MNTDSDHNDEYNDEPPKTIEWIVTPPGNDPPAIEFYESLLKLLAPYQPAENESESDKQFTTTDIVHAVELHFNIPQGDPEARGIDSGKLVGYLESMGYKAVNTGGLTLQWLMKKRVSA